MKETIQPQYAKESKAMGSNTRIYWKAVQLIFWLIGLTILLFMLFLPPVGVTLFWNILIPVAPALLVIGTGFWRNVCPLATTALLPDRFNLSRNIKLSARQRGILNAIGVGALFLIIPLRHVIFNTNGQATAFLIIMVAIVAVASGFFLERKSAWCSGLCPVHPVEKLYGSGVAFTTPNLHCNTCVRCSEPCPDSIGHSGGSGINSTEMTGSMNLLFGAFPGYVWGWFQAPDFMSINGWESMLVIYGYPVLGAIATSLIYFGMKRILRKEHEPVLMNLFAAAAVSCYYWFRLPQLIGFSALNTNGVLIDLSNSLPYWIPFVLNASSTSFFLWWMVIRKKPIRSWSKRPPFSNVLVPVDIDR